MLMFTTLTTSRLTLRRFKLADLPALRAYRTDPDVAQFQSWGDQDDETELRRFVAEMETREPLAGLQIAVALRDTDALLGDLYICGTTESQAELGYTFARAAQGQGYATEAVRGLLGYCFNELKLHRVVGIAAVENAPSWRLMERAGMRREAHARLSYRYRGVWHDEYQYAILQTEFLDSMTE